jgi:hypothetical protein
MGPRHKPCPPERRQEIGLDRLFRARDFPSLPRHRSEPDKAAQTIGKREDFGRHAAPAFSGRLILSRFRLVRQLRMSSY